MDGIQAQDDIVVLQFVDEHGDWVELVVLICVHGGRSILRDKKGGLGLAAVVREDKVKNVGDDDRWVVVVI